MLCTRTSITHQLDSVSGLLVFSLDVLTVRYADFNPGETCLPTPDDARASAVSCPAYTAAAYWPAPAGELGGVWEV